MGGGPSGPHPIKPHSDHNDRLAISHPPGGNGHGSNITPRYNCYSRCYTMLHVHVTEEC